MSFVNKKGGKWLLSEMWTKGEEIITSWKDKQRGNGINFINYLGEIYWKIRTGCETIWMVLTLSIISIKCINYLGGLYWKINTG